MCQRRLHVQDLTWPDRLLCGRRATGQQLVSLPAAKAYENLCHKCRDKLGWAWVLLAVTAEPKPGLQLYLFHEW